MVSKAQQEAVNRYLAKTYDDIKLRAPKGAREGYKKAVASLGYTSFNAFMLQALDEKLVREGAEPPKPAEDHDTI